MMVEIHCKLPPPVFVLLIISACCVVTGIHTMISDFRDAAGKPKLEGWEVCTFVFPVSCLLLIVVWRLL